MVNITYQDKVYRCRKGESVLDAALRQGVNLQFSCRNGVCQVCLQRAVKGELPKASQKGIKEKLRARGYFMPCVCRPRSDIEFESPVADDLYFTATVAAKERLSQHIYRIVLEPSLALDYHAGQFINLKHPDGTTRSYSLASVADEDYYLELHIQRMPNGVMSNWLIDALEVGSEIEMQGPNGNCFYQPASIDQNLLLIATGSGLAPLVGILRTALAAGHSGQIYLYHGSRLAQGLYLVNSLHELSRQHANFHYLPCVSGAVDAEQYHHGRADDVAFAQHEFLAGWCVHLAGNPDMVASAAARAATAGADDGLIFADSFVLKELRAAPRHDAEITPAESGRREFPPDGEMWAALHEGALMNRILTDFYDEVFDDALLAPYFTGVTRHRVIGKVYSFMKQIFTGERVYFGDRPRNSHHWMVIPDEVFDYRESLMAKWLRHHGLDEHLVQRWLAIEHSFRADIVKAKPFGRMVDGIVQPVEGFGHAVLEIGAVCDSCSQVLEPGEEVRYHLRLGHIYCHACGGV